MHVSVCLWSKQMRAVRPVISHFTSDMSQCPAERDTIQTPQETNFSIKLSPSPVLEWSLKKVVDWWQTTTFRQNLQRITLQISCLICRIARVKFRISIMCLWFKVRWFRKPSLDFSPLTQPAMCFPAKKTHYDAKYQLQTHNPSISVHLPCSMTECEHGRLVDGWV